ncbi:MAG: non-heme iron oxygenase ferredoxin subunit [Actinomycetota bacterium]
MKTRIQRSELTPGAPKLVMVDGTPVCVALIDDEIFAIGDTCTHSDASLSEGELNGSLIECWLHGAEFDMRTGEAVTPPATAPAKNFDVHIDGEDVTISRI